MDSGKVNCRLLSFCACFWVSGILIVLNFIHTPFLRPKVWQQRALAVSGDLFFTDALGPTAPRNWSTKWQSSAHMCFSRDHSPEAERHAACQFKMLCVVSSEQNEKGDWYYLAEKHEPHPKINFSSGIGPHHVDDRLFFPIKITTVKSFRAHFPKARIESKPHFLFSEYNAENYGHFLTDLLIPIYTVLEGFDALNTDIQLLHFRPRDPIGWSCDFQDKTGVANVRKRCDRFYESLIPMLSKHKVKDLSGLLQPDSAVCFDRFYVGASRFSTFCFDGADGRGMQEGDPRYPNMPCYNGRQKQLWDFRLYSKSNLGVPDIPPRKHQVLIWDRPDKRKFRGLDVLADNIRSQLNVSVVVITDFSKLTIEEQLATVGASTVHITGVGGGSFIAVHLPRGATTIRLSRNKDSLLDAWLFDYLGYVHPTYYNTEDDPVNMHALMNHVLTGLKRYEAFGVPFAPDNSG
jgi:hypothetical protein